MLSHLSYTLFSSLKSRLPTCKVGEVITTVSGIYQESTVKISARCADVSFSEIPSLKEWEDSAYGRGLFYFFSKNSTYDILLTTRITNLLRKNNIFLDCINFKLDLEEKKWSFIFSEKCNFPLRKNVNFPELYEGSYYHLKEVSQGECAIYFTKNSLSHISCFATSHLGPCVALIAHDRENGVGIFAHIDAETNLKKFMENLKERLKDKEEKPFTFNLLLKGGVNDGILKDKIKNLFEKNFSINFIPDTNTNPSLKSFVIDSSWGESVRLQRSVMVDFASKDPFKTLKSYEPFLNPYSIVHTQIYSDNKNAEKFLKDKAGQITFVENFNG